MAENDAQGGFEGGALTQEALDALLAAASAEGDETTNPDVWARELAASADELTASAEGGTASIDGGEGEAADGSALFGGAAPGNGSAAGAVVDLPSFAAPGARVFGAGEVSGMTRVRDIPLEVTVELGRTRLLIRDILDLGTGSIIELDKIAGEPVDLFANGLMVARGEVIVIDDNFGVRVTEIITAAERSQGKEAAALAA